jgi:hypothetical protein
VEAKYPGSGIRTRDAIEQTGLVVAGTLVEVGTPSPGPPGAHRFDNARFRVEEILTPVSNEPLPGNALSLSYIRQVIPESAAEIAPQAGRRYVLFCTLKPGRQMHALKMLPHSAEVVRMVASAFETGARHSATAIRLA